MILFPILAAAALPVEVPEYDCADTAIQFELNECASAEYARADDRLNEQWAITLEAFRARSPENAARLVGAQRAWITFRDTECYARFPYELGVSLDKMLNLYCLTQLTEERTKQLQEIAEEF